MGLDAYAFTRVKKYEGPMEEGEPIDNDGNYERLGWNMDCFKGREAPLTEGWYEFESCTDAFHGGYLSYNHWREMLAELAGWPASRVSGEISEAHVHTGSAWRADGGLFWELLNFADNEGTLGPDVCKKLLGDFDRFETKAAEHPDEWFRRCYEQFHKAVRAAADGGAIKFC